MKRPILFSVAILACASVALAKNAGDLLKQYLDNPKESVKAEVLALVEIVSVDTDATPGNNWTQSGSLHLKTIEAVGGGLPKQFAVRFFKRDAEGEDAIVGSYATSWTMKPDDETYFGSALIKGKLEDFKRVSKYFLYTCSYKTVPKE